MMQEDDEPRKPKRIELGSDLSALSVEELEEYLETLDREKARVDAEISSKKAHKEAAAAIFRR